MDPAQTRLLTITRRHFFQQGALGLGTAALSSLLAESSPAAAGNLRTTGGLLELPHLAPRANRAIYLFMSGAPSQMAVFVLH